MNIIIPECHHNQLIPENYWEKFKKADHNPRQVLCTLLSIGFVVTVHMVFRMIKHPFRVEQLCDGIQDFPDCKNISSSSKNPFCNLAIVVTLVL